MMGIINSFRGEEEGGKNSKYTLWIGKEDGKERKKRKKGKKERKVGNRSMENKCFGI